MTAGVSYPANAPNVISTSQYDTSRECCINCIEEPECTVWTWHSNSGNCAIKSGNLSPQSAPDTANSGGPLLFDESFIMD